MTDEEYRQWQHKAFIYQPSLKAWLAENSPDPQDTLRLWRRILQPYELSDCLQVLDNWAVGVWESPRAYERDQYAALVRKKVEEMLSARRKRAEGRRRLKVYAQRKNELHSPEVGSLMDSNMRQCFLALKPIHKQLLDGEITGEEYRSRADAVLEMLV